VDHTALMSSAPYWMHDGSGNYFVFTGFSGPTTLTGVPAAGSYGALAVPLANGAPIFQSAQLNVTAIHTLTAAVEVAVEIGEAIVVRAEVDDAAAQAVIAAIEGEDGIHEHYVADGESSYTWAWQRAVTEIAVFGAPLLRASVITDDMNAVPGAELSVAISAPGALTDTLVIDTVDLEFPQANQPPRRTCEASTVKLETVLDALKSQ